MTTFTPGTSYSPETLKQIETLLNVGIALSGEKDHNKLLEMILTEARKITRADAGTLFLREGDRLIFKIIQNETLNIFQGANGEKIDLPEVILAGENTENISGYVAVTKKSVNVPDVYDAQNFDFRGPKKYDLLTGYRTRSMLVIPLENHEGEVIGVLQLLNARNLQGEVVPFEPYYEKVISSLASQAAISLTNAQFIEDIENLLNSFVEVMATTIDARSPYNANHTRRVARMAEEFARVISAGTVGKLKDEYFDEERTDQLVMAAWLHDIGKIATPSKVMDKATRLEERYELIMQRLDYIAAQTRLAYLETLQPEPSLAELLAEVEAARTLITEANNPATFVTQEMQARLQAIAGRTYLSWSGENQNWLTLAELEALSVDRGTLTATERKIMEEHVEITGRILEVVPFPNKLRHVPEWAVLHHEYLDGKGYPKGLKAGEVPLEGCILTLLDIFDALTASDRPYKKAMTPETALQILGRMVVEGKLHAGLFEIFSEGKVWECLKVLNL